MPHTGVGAVSTILHHYNNDAVPIGAYMAEDAPSGWHQHHYVNSIVEQWPGPIHDSGQVWSSTTIYRMVLSKQEDHSVVVATVGMLSALADLFRSGADEWCVRPRRDFSHYVVSTSHS
eukprot:5634394-Prymnesium_polylepis.2